MKKNVRNALAISGLAIAIGASGLTLNASANESGNGRGLKIESHQNPSKIFKAKKTDQTEKTKWQKHMIRGVVSAVSADSITITRGDKTFVANISPETKIMSRSWIATPLSEIKTGHKIKISGTLTGSTITAKTIRDISVPTPETK